MLAECVMMVPKSLGACVVFKMGTSSSGNTVYNQAEGGVSEDHPTLYKCQQCRRVEPIN